MTNHPINPKTLIISFIIAALIALLAFYWARPSSKAPSVASPKTNFVIVDTYKGCDVVQWSDNQMATYKYFLHCNNTRPVYKDQ